MIGWEMFGCEPCMPAYITPEQPPRRVWIWSNGSHAELRDDVGRVVGPRHPGVAGAVAWALAAGMIDPQRSVLTSGAANAILRARADADLPADADLLGPWRLDSPGRAGGTHPSATPPADHQGDRGDILASDARPGVFAPAGEAPRDGGA